MRLIPINAIPIQSLTFSYSGYKYDFTFRDCDGFVVYDIDIDGSNIISGQRFAIGSLMITSKYLEVDGNFILSSESGNQDADYTEFGDSQNLYYMTSIEAEEFRDEY